MPGKEEFIEIYTQHIHREGSAELLDYLEHGMDAEPFLRTYDLINIRTVQP